MKLSVPFSATVGAVLTTLFIQNATHAIVATDNTALYNQQVQSGQFSGVVALQTYNPLDQLFNPFCTGSLLSGGQHILTAAHCLTETGTSILSSNLLSQPFVATFNLLNGLAQVPIQDLFILPNWTGSLDEGNDLAVLSLLTPAPTTAAQYDIYRNNDELGQTFTKVGYGNYGIGLTGEVEGSVFDGFGFYGQNQFEATEADRQGLLSFPGTSAAESQLLYDFDSGYATENLIGSLGVGSSEVNTARGDSGGPAFIGDRIAGVTSYGLGNPGLRQSTDIDDTTNSTFGELSGDTRVSTYASFVDTVLAGNVAPTERNQAASVPEPSIVLGIIALGA
ncbi:MULTISPECIES: trypsin-like serine protease [Trichocoleus]|uniref:S1 family peptidase n=1 Tax=Trichocoleus desertorum GB2-A4 TaxID=2933944 RepID=A0ABV0JHW4_9CYAN|nr:trypsin-like serine protease [Trichocoleus sp. FACHB-46]MBD1860056.1 trypsin-like serine protease [Trichocoleus sp. FACHB-46]